MAVKVLKLRRDDVCVVCATELVVGTEASWDGTAKTVTCLGCSGGTVEPAIDRGEAGASAAREYERRSSRERRRKEAVVEKDARWRQEITEARPILGRVATALTPKPVISPESQSTKAWKTGAEGEERVAQILDGRDGVRALHDRRVPGSKANIDHLAISASGVYVVDAKKYSGKVEQRDLGGWLRTDLRLCVRNRDRTKLVHGVEKQMEVVATAMATAGIEAPIRGVLCFVGAEWPLLFAKPVVFGRVVALWPGALGNLVAQPGPLNADDVDRVAQVLAGALKRA